MHGQFVWYELMTRDAASARRFYPSFTGWGTDEFDKMQYTMWTVDGVPFGGVVQLRPEQIAQGLPTHWLPYVAVDDVDGSASKAQGLGGKLLYGPMDIPGTGRFAAISDPQGAVLAIYKSLDPGEGFDGRRQIGRMVWHELMTTDYRAAMDFYARLFGWQPTNAFDMGDIGTYQMFGQRGAEYGGMFNRTADHGDVPPFWACYIHVKDVKKAADTAVKKGGTLMLGPMEVPGGDIVAMLMDPQGGIFALHQEPLGTADGGQKGAQQKGAQQKGAQKTGQKSGQKGARKGAKKSARKGAKKSARKGASKSARKGAKKSAKRTAKKGARRSGRRAMKKSARKKGRR